MNASCADKLESFKPQELSNMLVAYAKTEHYEQYMLARIDEVQSKHAYTRDASLQVTPGCLSPGLL